MVDVGAEVDDSVAEVLVAGGVDSEVDDSVEDEQVASGRSIS